MKIIYGNCRVKNYMKEDHRSYRRDICIFCEKKSLKKFRLFQAFRFAAAKVASISAMIFFHIDVFMLFVCLKYNICTTNVFT